jgi:phage terminase small subunit
MPNVKGSIRKTTAELALTGALDAKPGRYANRRNEPKPTAPLGTPPKHLTTEQKKIWKEIANLCPPDVLFGSDRIVLEMICRLTQKLRSGTIKALEQNLLLTSLQQLGMTPLARSRIAVPKKDKSRDDLKDLLPQANDVHRESEAVH